MVFGVVFIAGDLTGSVDRVASNALGELLRVGSNVGHHLD